MSHMSNEMTSLITSESYELLLDRRCPHNSRNVVGINTLHHGTQPQGLNTVVSHDRHMVLIRSRIEIKGQSLLGLNIGVQSGLIRSSADIAVRSDPSFSSHPDASQRILYATTSENSTTSHRRYQSSHNSMETFKVTPVSPENRCWRCILLNYPCDRMPICLTCLALGNEGLTTLSCKRGHIIRTFDVEFQSRKSLTPLCKSRITPLTDLIELSESEWILCTGKHYWKLTVDYFRLGRELSFKHSIVDLSNFLAPAHYSTDPLSAYCMFLQQFWSTLERWPNVYEPLSLKFIANPASWQIFLFESLPEPMDAVEEASNSPIMLAYRCLILTRRLGTFAHHFPIDWLIVDHFAVANYDILEANVQQGQGDNSPSIRPAISLERMTEEFKHRDVENKMSGEDTLPRLLGRAIELARHKILSGKPKDWVTVFWVLGLLLLVHSDLEEASGFTDTLLNGQHKLWNAIESLAGLYLHCSGDLHPLNPEGMDKEWFQLLTGLTGDRQCLEDFFSCNDIWIEEYEEDDHTVVRNHVKHFVKHLDNFVHGWTRL